MHLVPPSPRSPRAILRAAVALAALLLLAVVCDVTASPGREGEDSDGEEAWGTQMELPGAWAGVYIFDLREGRELVSSAADRLFTPASVTKALTAAAVLSLNDSADRFATPVMAVGRIDDRQGLLRGNLVIEGSGDPTLGSRHMASAQGLADSVAAGLRALGVTRVEGRVIAGNAPFVEEERPSGWLEDDWDQPYGANLFALNWRDNTRSVSVTRPKKVTTRNRKGRRRTKTVNTTVSEARSNPSPADSLAAQLARSLTAAGIEVEGAELDDVRGPATPVYIHLSPRYIDILRSLMVRSDNLFAEGMLRTVAPGGTRQEAIATERELFFDDAELPASQGLLFEDGSGLSRHNALTPRFLGNVLAWMGTGSQARSYARLFPRVGREGTVRNFMADSPLAGRLVLKTGSMRNVQSYAGYLLDDTGLPQAVVVILANDFSITRPALRQRIAALLEQTLLPPADTLAAPPPL